MHTCNFVFSFHAGINQKEEQEAWRKRSSCIRNPLKTIDKLSLMKTLSFMLFLEVILNIRSLDRKNDEFFFKKIEFIKIKCKKFVFCRSFIEINVAIFVIFLDLFCFVTKCA